MNKALVAKVEEYVLAHREEIVKTFEELINIKDFWRDVDGVNAVGEWLKDAFEAEGFDCELVEFSPQAGKLLTGTLGVHRSGAPIMFAGHMDTALANDMYADAPFRIEDGCAYGPGVLDMKGGIIIALYVVKALNAIGYADRPIKIIFAPDEEGLHNYTTVAEYIKEHSSGCLFALNMETGLMDNGLAVGRKGRLGIDVFVTGKSAHAGAAFEDGISAIVEMAQKVGVACVPGSSFFDEDVNHIVRLHFAKKDETLLSALDRLSRWTGKTRSELVRDALRAQALRETLRQLQGELAPQARAAGWLTEDDILRDVS